MELSGHLLISVGVSPFFQHGDLAYNTGDLASTRWVAPKKAIPCSDPARSAGT